MSLEKITKARTELLISEPFYGSLALRLKITEEPSIDTMATDGTYLYFNKDWVATLSKDELKGTLVHELCHCAYLHPFRIGKRHRLRANVAADLAINPLIKKHGFKLPPGALDDPNYYDMGMEEIYAKLVSDPNYAGLKQLEDLMKNQTMFDPSQVNEGDGKGNAKGMTSVDWQIAAEQAAAMAKAAGKMPGGLERLLHAAHASKTDWRSILRRFIDENIMPSNYSWVRPNRRFAAQGTYLPGVTKENTPRIGVGVDTSGSISDKMLRMFAAEIDAIMTEAQPEAITVAYCDTEIRGIDEFRFGEGEIAFTAYNGGGGTAFCPVFDYFKQDPPACIIYMTDMDCFDKPEDPHIPVLWVAPIGTRKQGPFGEMVLVDMEEE